MLEKPNIPAQLIISRLQEEYDLRVAELTFLPIGADSRTAVYRVDASNGTAYFLKLRKNFADVIVRVPLFLKEIGIEAIIAPFETQSKQPWADFGDYKIILYPFIDGKNGFEVDLTDRQRETLGSAFKRIHTARIPPKLGNLIRKETFDLGWRESMRRYLVRVESNTFIDTTAAKLAEFMRSKQGEISRIVERSEQLGSELRSKLWEFSLCHSDIHGGNILLSDKGQLYIVDWDDPILAPKERDLMFIGGGSDTLWQTSREIELFYQGYGQAEINLTALAYYRYERVIEDLAVICDLILPTNAGGEDRERSYGWFTSNFEAESTIDIAKNTDKRLK
jgi:spectinomycin phosphotransferase